VSVERITCAQGTPPFFRSKRAACADVFSNGTRYTCCRGHPPKPRRKTRAAVRLCKYVGKHHFPHSHGLRIHARLVARASVPFASSVIQPANLSPPARLPHAPATAGRMGHASLALWGGVFQCPRVLHAPAGLCADLLSGRPRRVCAASHGLRIPARLVARASVPFASSVIQPANLASCSTAARTCCGRRLATRHSMPRSHARSSPPERGGIEPLRSVHLTRSRGKQPNSRTLSPFCRPACKAQAGSDAARVSRADGLDDMRPGGVRRSVCLKRADDIGSAATDKYSRPVLPGEPVIVFRVMLFLLSR
jgi:hypothetical protein